jgi:phosphomethylpyrimidine synthase
MRITRDIREYAESQGIDNEQALTQKLEQKSREFIEKGSELYLKV